MMSGKVVLIESFFESRSRLELIGKILECVENNFSKFNILCGSRTSPVLLNKYLAFMIHHKLIAKEISGRLIFFKMTESGYKMLELYKDYMRLVGDDTEKRYYQRN